MLIDLEILLIKVTNLSLVYLSELTALPCRTLETKSEANRINYAFLEDDNWVLENLNFECTWAGTLEMWT